MFHAEALLSGLEKLQPEPPSQQVTTVLVANGNGHNAVNGQSHQQLAKEPDKASGNGVQLLSESQVAVQDSASNEESSIDDDLEFLPPYRDLTLPDARAKLLHDNAGTILKLDFVVRSLYGKLPAPQIVTLTEQVKQSIESGVEEGRWHRDALNHPDNSDCYTWNLPGESQNPGASCDDVDINDVDSDDIEEESLTPPPETLSVPDDVVSEVELLELVDKGVLTLNKMKQVSLELHLFGYGSIKYPKTFASFLARNYVNRSVIQRFI